MIGFRKKHFAVGVHVKNAAPALDQLGREIKFLLDGSFQTGSSGKVVSNPAVFDSNVHRVPFRSVQKPSSPLLRGTPLGCAVRFVCYKSDPRTPGLDVWPRPVAPTKDIPQWGFLTDVPIAEIGVGSRGAPWPDVLIL